MDKEVINRNKLKLGIFSNSLLVTFTFFYLVSFANKNFNYVYGQIPLFTVQWSEVYRLITGIFTSYNLIDYLLNISVVLLFVNSHENQEGTLKTFIKFFLSAIFIQAFTILIYCSIHILFPYVLSFTVKPALATGISFLTKHILLTEDKTFLFYPNCIANNRWLVVIYLLFGVLFNYSEVKFEVFFALYYGFLMCKFPKYFDYSPNEEAILHFEKNENYKFLFNFESWILIEECFFKGVCYRGNDIENGKQIEQVEHLDEGESEHMDFSENSEFKLIERNHLIIDGTENNIQLNSKIKL
jgi:membrane associated rhomboid family serine protease